MKVKARIAGVFGQETVMAEGMVQLQEGATVRKLFDRADEALALKKSRPFRQSLKRGLAPTVLLNGDRLDLPAGLKQVLREGDEISVLMPMLGG
ncbi:MAG: hypothetical protein AB1641_01310 [Thermodesulfobacteriota bacterium]